jgi:hypothetical protein
MFLICSVGANLEGNRLRSNAGDTEVEEGNISQ